MLSQKRLVQAESGCISCSPSGGSAGGWSLEELARVCLASHLVLPVPTLEEQEAGSRVGTPDSPAACRVWQVPASKIPQDRLD